MQSLLGGHFEKETRLEGLWVLWGVLRGNGGREKGGRREEVEEVGTRGEDVEGCGKGREGATQLCFCRQLRVSSRAERDGREVEIEMERWC